MHANEQNTFTSYYQQTLDILEAAIKKHALYHNAKRCFSHKDSVKTITVRF